MLAKTLHVLVGFGEHCLAREENARALELATHVINHTAAHALDRDLAQAVLNKAVANGAALPEQPSTSLEELMTSILTHPYNVTPNAPYRPGVTPT